MSQDDRPQDKKDQQDEKPSIERRAIESVTLLLSVLTLGGLALFLGLQAKEPTSEFAQVRSQVLWERAQRKGGRTILPVEVENRGRHTLREVSVRVSFVEGGREQEHDIGFDFLAGGARREAFLLFDRDVAVLKASAKIKSEPSFYLVD